METTEFFSDAILWSLVRKFASENNVNSTDDLMAEARAAAAFAIKKFKGRNKAKMETFLVSVVRNRLLNLMRDSDDGLNITFCEDTPEVVAEQTIDDFHFTLSMKQILTPTEFDVFQKKFVEDQTEREIATELNWSRRRVRECLFRIYQRYAFIEESHHKVLTSRQLTNRWLDDSPL